MLPWQITEICLYIFLWWIAVLMHLFTCVKSKAVQTFSLQSHCQLLLLKLKPVGRALVYSGRTEGLEEGFVCGIEWRGERKRERERWGCQRVVVMPQLIHSSLHSCTLSVEESWCWERGQRVKAERSVQQKETVLLELNTMTSCVLASGGKYIYIKCATKKTRMAIF